MNHGLNIDLENEHQDGSEWQFGALSLDCIADIPVDERKEWLPQGELQFGTEDFMDCTTRGPVNIYEAKFFYLFRGGMRPENRSWLKEKGYEKDGRITFSDRFISIKARTTRAGNSLKAPLQTIHESGLIPKDMLPRREGMTFDEYYSGLTKEMEDLGMEFLTRFSLNYDQVSTKKMQESLNKGLLSVGLHAWPNPQGGIYQKTDDPFNHCVAAFAPLSFIFDNYEDAVDGDFVKQISPDYSLFAWGYRPIISAEHVPEVNQERKPGPSIWDNVVMFFSHIRFA